MDCNISFNNSNTNELIRLYESKCTEVQNLYELSTKLQKKLEARKFTIERLKLENEVVTSLSETTSKNYNALLTEHETLKAKYSELENDYNFGINDYQIKYQTVSQELLDCKEKLQQYEGERDSHYVNTILGKNRNIKKSKTQESLENKYVVLEQNYKSLQDKYEKIVEESQSSQVMTNTKELEEKLVSVENELSDYQIKYQEVNEELVKCRQRSQQSEHQSSNMPFLDSVVQPSLKDVNDLRLQSASDQESSFIAYDNIEQHFGSEVITDTQDIQDQLSLKEKELSVYQDSCQAINQELAECKKELEKFELSRRNRSLIKKNNTKKTQPLNLDALQVQYALLEEDYKNLEKQFKESTNHQSFQVDTNIEELETKLASSEKNLRDCKQKHQLKVDNLMQSKKLLMDVNKKLQSQVNKLKNYEQQYYSILEQKECLELEFNLKMGDLKNEKEQLVADKMELNNRISELVAQIREIEETPTDTCIDDIMKDMIFMPNIVSPLYDSIEQVKETSQLPSNLLELDSDIVDSKFTFNSIENEFSKKLEIRRKFKETARRKRHKFSLSRVLRVLQKNNLSFIISKGIVPHFGCSNMMYVPRQSKRYLSHSRTNVHKQLNCTLSCCKNLHKKPKGACLEVSKNGTCSDIVEIKHEDDISCDGDVESESLTNILSSSEFQPTPPESLIISSKDCKANSQLGTRRRSLRLMSKESNCMLIETPLDVSNVDENTLELPSEDTLHTVQKIDETKSLDITRLELLVQNQQVSKQISPKQHQKSIQEKKKKVSKLATIRKSLRLLNKSENFKSTNKNLLNINPSNDGQEEYLKPKRKRIAHIPHQRQNNMTKENSTCQTSVETILRLNENSESIIPQIMHTVENQNVKKLNSVLNISNGPKKLLEENNHRFSTVIKPNLFYELFEKDDIEKEYDCPQSPSQNEQECNSNIATMKIIPLERVQKLQVSKIEKYITELFNYSMDEAAMNEVIEQFRNQDSKYIAEIILEKVSTDTGTPVVENPIAPLLTDIQKILLGFMIALEKNNIVNVFNDFLLLVERKLLTNTNIKELTSLARFYAAVLKYQKDIFRIRLFCCEIFYFQTDAAIPIFYTILTSWIEVFPKMDEDVPLARVLVQAVYLKTCKDPDYHLLQLRSLLASFYKYPSERWNSDQMFEELFNEYKGNPIRSSDFALLIFCKNHEEKWVYNKIQDFIKPLLDQITVDNFKAAVIILIGNLSYSFKFNSPYISQIRQWFQNFDTDDVPIVIKRSVHLCLKRLNSKPKHLNKK